MIKKICECGCGDFVKKEKNKFINGHQNKGMVEKEKRS